MAEALERSDFQKLNLMHFEFQFLLQTLTISWTGSTLLTAEISRKKNSVDFIVVTILQSKLKDQSSAFIQSYLLTRTLTNDSKNADKNDKKKQLVT